MALVPAPDQVDLSSLKRGNRYVGILFSFPVWYGNHAIKLAKKNAEEHTHQWTIFLRSATHIDLSCFVKKVVFTVHPSVPNHIRVIEKPPYVFEATGWGEFDVNVKIFFHDTAEKPVELYFGLRLHNLPTVTTPDGVLAYSEVYDELVFQSPTLSMYDRIVKAQESFLEPSIQGPLIYSKLNVQADYVSVLKAKDKIEAERKKLKGTLRSLESELKELSGSQ